MEDAARGVRDDTSAARRARRRANVERRPALARTLAGNGLHVLVLWSFAVAQPLYDILARHAEFFAVRGSTSGEIVFFALALVVVPVLALLALEALIGVVAPRLLAGVHLVVVGALVALLLVQALDEKTGLGAPAVIGTSLALGAVTMLVYRRVALARTFLTVLTPAPLVFVGLFLFNSPVERLVLTSDPAVAASGPVDATRPVVLVLFDEFPLTSLLTADGEIDRGRYPNFARLAADSYWFRNTTTVDEATTQAVPAILTGRYPVGERRLPIFAEHPENLFTLLGRDYRMNVWEAQTRLCPAELCRDRAREARLTTRLRSLFTDASVVYAHLVAPASIEERLPPITGAWSGFLDDPGGADPERGIGTDKPDDGKVGAFRRFVETIEPSRRPTLHFVHSMLPHASWVYTPSCRRSLVRRRAPGLEDTRAVWRDDETLVVEALRRHLFQVGCADRLLGELVARLRKTRLYDRAVLVVVSDHGVSARPGQPRRAAVAETNLADIAYVPFFVRVPGRGRGVVDEHRQTVDVLPTIADALGVSLPWDVGGSSAFVDDHPDDVQVNTERGVIRMDSSELLRRRQAAVERLVRYFGSGGWETAVHGGGSYAALAGRRVEGLPVVDGPDARQLNPRIAELLADLPARSPYVPTPIVGIVTGAGAARGRPLAVAVGGRIAVVTAPYETARSDRVAFAAYVPESAFRPGVNVVDLYWVNRVGGGFELERVGRRSPG